MARKPIMIMGCTSDAGKSFLAVALCRHFANQGIRVAPFKALNMSNHAAVTLDGLEMGRAQYLQALAARTVPQVRMNPVLVKPSAETRSQVIVSGKADPLVSALSWTERKAHVWPAVCESLYSLMGDYDQIIIEGAGSPAEVNLRASDIANMSVAIESQAEVYLVADIDRGGAFAHLLGTWMCLEAAERALIRGFVLNKFRGDAVLLDPAIDWLYERTGVRIVATVPQIQHLLPEEDTFHHRGQRSRHKINIALITYPYASNLDEFDPLIFENGVEVIPLRHMCSLTGFDAVILPGSKNSAASLRYLRQNGLVAEITNAASRGVPVLGICGGMQMLGRHIADPYEIEGGDVSGLGLLDLTTTLCMDKITSPAPRWLAGRN